jgi:hypothetical protein
VAASTTGALAATEGVTDVATAVAAAVVAAAVEAAAVGTAAAVAAAAAAEAAEAMAAAAVAAMAAAAAAAAAEAAEAAVASAEVALAAAAAAAAEAAAATASAVAAAAAAATAEAAVAAAEEAAAAAASAAAAVEAAVAAAIAEQEAEQAAAGAVNRGLLAAAAANQEVGIIVAAADNERAGRGGAEAAAVNPKIKNLVDTIHLVQGNFIMNSDFKDQILSFFYDSPNVEDLKIKLKSFYDKLSLDNQQQEHDSDDNQQQEHDLDRHLNNLQNADDSGEAISIECNNINEFLQLLSLFSCYKIDKQILELGLNEQESKEINEKFKELFNYMLMLIDTQIINQRSTGDYQEKLTSLLTSLIEIFPPAQVESAVQMEIGGVGLGALDGFEGVQAAAVAGAESAPAPAPAKDGGPVASEAGAPPPTRASSVPAPVPVPVSQPTPTRATSAPGGAKVDRAGEVPAPAKDGGAAAEVLSAGAGEEGGEDNSDSESEGEEVMEEVTEEAKKMEKLAIRGETLYEYGIDGRLIELYDTKGNKITTQQQDRFNEQLEIYKNLLKEYNKGFRGEEDESLGVKDESFASYRKLGIARKTRDDNYKIKSEKDNTDRIKFVKKYCQNKRSLYNPGTGMFFVGDTFSPLWAFSGFARSARKNYDPYSKLQKITDKLNQSSNESVIADEEIMHAITIVREIDIAESLYDKLFPPIKTTDQGSSGESLKHKSVEISDRDEQKFSFEELNAILLNWENIKEKLINNSDVIKKINLSLESNFSYKGTTISLKDYFKEHHPRYEKKIKPAIEDFRKELIKPSQSTSSPLISISGFTFARR